MASVQRYTKGFRLIETEAKCPEPAKKQALNRCNPDAVPLPEYLDLAASWGQQNGLSTVAMQKLLTCVTLSVSLDSAQVGVCAEYQ